MPRFAANLSMLFPQLPFLDRFAAAAKAGFEAVEFLFPYEYEPATLSRLLADNGLKLVLFNALPGDWSRGERGIACLPGRESEFREGIRRALEIAHRLSCPLLHVMAGIAPPGVERLTLATRYGANLAWAAEQANDAGIGLAIEPINRRDMPGYFLDSAEDAAAILAAFPGRPIGLQFDVYHCQIAGGDLVTRLKALMPLIAHIQIADVPGRHEPGSGEIGWQAVFAAIDTLGFTGYVGCEYRPEGDTLAGLAWRKRFCP